MNNQSLLHNVYLFKTLSSEQLDRISAACHTEVFSAREEVFAQGDKAFAVYFIKYGSVQIQQRTKSGESIQVATLATGSHFGEMAFVDNEARSASAKTVEKSEVVILPYDKLNVILKEHGGIAVEFYKQLALFLCGRLRVTTNDLSFSRERNLSHF